jgi:Arc/MetJ family transcription regulator
VSDGRGADVAFVEDASRGLVQERVERCLPERRQAGGRLTTTDEVASPR